MRFEERSEIIERYLKGLMTDVELASFNAMVKEDAKFAQEVDLNRQLKSALDDWKSMQLRKKLRAIQDENDRRPAVQIFLRSQWKAIAAIFAAIVILSGIMISRISSEPSMEDLYVKYHQAAKPIMIQRSGNVNPESEQFGKGMQFYANGKYHEAIQLFSEKSNNTASRFYLGVSLLEIGDCTKAAQIFEALQNEKVNLFVDQSEWYLALCYVKAGDKAKAINQLKRVADSQNYFNQKASELLTELDPKN